ncbi:Ribosomal Biogenesis Protein Las1L, partial [Manis pentadactyla]
VQTATTVEKDVSSAASQDPYRIKQQNPEDTGTEAMVNENVRVMAQQRNKTAQEKTEQDRKWMSLKMLHLLEDIF